MKKEPLDGKAKSLMQVYVSRFYQGDSHLLSAFLKKDSLAPSEDATEDVQFDFHRYRL